MLNSLIRCWDLKLHLRDLPCATREFWSGICSLWLMIHFVRLLLIGDVQTVMDLTTWNRAVHTQLTLGLLLIAASGQKHQTHDQIVEVQPFRWASERGVNNLEHTKHTAECDKRGQTSQSRWVHPVDDTMNELADVHSSAELMTETPASSRFHVNIVVFKTRTMSRCSIITSCKIYYNLIKEPCIGDNLCECADCERLCVPNIITLWLQNSGDDL